MWFECAADNASTAPSTEALKVWFAQYDTDNELQRQVWHRFNLTGGRKLVAWARKQFFFTNATAEQVNTLRCPR